MPSDVPERLLLIQLRHLGDVVLTSALLQDLREAFPSARIDFLTGPTSAVLLRGNPFATDVLVYDRNHPLRTARQVRSRRYQWIFDAQSSPRSGPLVLFSGALRRVGWRVSVPWRLVFTETVERGGSAGYAVVDRQRLLQAMQVPVVPRRPRLYLEEVERARGETDITALGLPAGAPRVGFVLSTGNPPSAWPVERYAELAKRLAGDGVAPIMLGTVGDEDLVARGIALAQGAFRADVPELRRFLGVVAALDVLVTGDTGPAHLAMALDVPTVTLYGPSYAAYWNPGLPTSVAVNSPRTRCSACASGGRRTNAGHTCMLEIEVGAVRSRVLELVAATSPRRLS